MCDVTNQYQNNLITLDHYLERILLQIVSLYIVYVFWSPKIIEVDLEQTAVIININK